MNVIKLDHPHKLHQDDFPPLSIALGFFDGVHKGHQQVIKSAIETAKQNGWKSAVMTFNPHPLAVLKKDQAVHYITDLEEKISLIEKLGVDYLFIANFTPEFASLSPQEFVDQFLIGLHVKHVTAGFDYSYGKFGKGTMETLPEHARGAFSQTVIGRIDMDDSKISSTRIRQALSEGEMETFYQLTGRHYATTGTVVHGEKRGRELGFPTANTELPDELIIPAIGIYAVRVAVDGKWYMGVCSVGYKPTFHDTHPDKPFVEVYIIDFNDSIYDSSITIEWHKRLRGEIKFTSVEALIDQIKSDTENTKHYFKNH
ncbi:bifunctional riboflavin kinase/FAD synthetase [Bacillus testis]|uniref:bifunctional riboflavin kinase/FAD synthetase n=1 Tax=Bacillus testis TaxID=1622072 RepID=UPI00067EFF4F|nr:bifunctional riboflavin kinase/FAD synthetase [Bacillus testis]